MLIISKIELRHGKKKVISNLDDIIDLYGQDRATGEGVKTSVEANEIMTPIEETSVIDLDSETQGQEELNIGDDYLSPNTTNSQKRLHWGSPNLKQICCGNSLCS